MEKDLSEYFSELNLTKLKEFAAEWAGWHPVIEKILLFKENPIIDEESKYVLVAVTPGFPDQKILQIKKEYVKERRRIVRAKRLSKRRVLAEMEKLRDRKEKKLKMLSEEEQMAIRARNWSSPDCLHIQSTLNKAYMGNKPQEIIGRWMWSNVSNSKIEETDIAETVKQESGIVLYEKYHEDQTPQEEKKEVTPFEYSSDFCSITKDGEPILLTLKQAQVVQILFDEWKKGTPGMHQSNIIRKVSPDTSTKRLRDIFKTNPDAWKKLFESKKKGIFSLKT